MSSPKRPVRLCFAPSLPFSNYWGEGALSSWVKQPKLDAERSVYLVLRLRISGDILPFLYIPPCRAEEQAFLLCKTADLQKENTEILV